MNHGIILIALSATLYGTIGYFGTALQQQGLMLRDVLLWRFLLSSGVLLFFLPLFVKGNLKQHAKNLLVFLVLGAIFYGGGTALYFEASKTIGTGLAMVIFFAYPIFVVLLSVLVHKIQLGRATALSLGLIVVGCVLIAFGDGLDVDFDLWGIFLAALSGLAYGAYVFCSKQANQSTPPLLATFTVCVGAAFGNFIYVLIGGHDFYWPENLNIWLLISGFSILGTILPVLLLLAGMKSVSASKASIISVLEPVTVLAVGATILHESVTSLQLVGALVIMCSALVVQLDKEQTSLGPTTA